MAGVFDYARLLFRMIFVPAKEKTLNFPEVGWTITIPKGFELLPDKKIEMMSKRGAAVLEAIADRKISYPGKTKFIAVHELQNVFSCDFTNLDEFQERIWDRQKDELQNSVLNSLYAGYKSYASVNIATETDARQKGNITFKTYEIIVTTPQRELERIRYFSTVYKNYGIHITMGFAEPSAGEQMLNALRNSTFTA